MATIYRKIITCQTNFPIQTAENATKITGCYHNDAITDTTPNQMSFILAKIAQKYLFVCFTASL